MYSRNIIFVLFIKIISTTLKYKSLTLRLHENRNNIKKLNRFQ